MSYLFRAAVTAACAWLLFVPALASDSCEGVPGITPICRFQAPEDLELTPDRRGLIVSEYGGLVDPIPGRISLLDLSTYQTRVLYPRPGGDGTPDWGDSHCPGPLSTDISPHGIHLSQRQDGQWQLLVVNHRFRESVEYFQVAETGTLTWRGCVVMPAKAWLNDVVGLPNGGFLATHMADKDPQDPNPIVTLLSANASGKLFAWHPGMMVTEADDTRWPFPNGIQITDDSRTLFINIYHLGEVHKIDLATGRLLGIAKVKAPDNLSWNEDGKLLVASHTGEVDYAAGECTSLDSGYCPMAFQVVLLDPNTLQTQVVFQHEGAPMGGGTVAVERADKLYIGAFSGNRLIEVTSKK